MKILVRTFISDFLAILEEILATVSAMWTSYLFLTVLCVTQDQHVSHKMVELYEFAASLMNRNKMEAKLHALQSMVLSHLCYVMLCMYVSMHECS